MAAITKFGPEESIAEKSTAEYSTILRDQAGVPIDSSTVTVLTVTLTDPSGTPLNGRNAQDCLDINDGMLALGGAFTFTLQPADTALTGGAEAQLRHLTFHCEFSGGEMNHQVNFYVRNLIGVS